MILVTGGTGLVGSHLLFELTRQGYKIRALKRPTSDLNGVRVVFGYYCDNPDKLLSQIEWFEADITDPVGLFSAMKGIRKVYHTAGYISFDPRDKQILMKINVEGTAGLVNACLDENIEKLCHVSSVAAIGSAPQGQMVTEEIFWTSADKDTPYAYSKYQSEMEVWRGINEGLNAIIVNPSVIVGPGFWNRGSMLLFQAIWKGLKYYTEGVAGYVDVRDVVKAMIHLMDGEYKGERYILSSENISYKEIFGMIANSLGKVPPYHLATHRKIKMVRHLDLMKSLITGSKRQLTDETIAAGVGITYLSNAKIKNNTGIVFRPVRESVNDTAKLFLGTKNPDI